MRNIFFLTICLFLFLATPVAARAQMRTNSNTVTTTVGNPPSSSSGDVLSWAQKITSSLQIGSDGGLDKLATSISSGLYSTGTSEKYWCTYLVVDSYNLSGHSGLSTGSQGAVTGMVAFWQNTPGYVFLDYTANQQILSQISPGYAIFFLADDYNFNHAAIVKSITWANQNAGDGTLETYDANLPPSWGTVISYNIWGWNIKGILNYSNYHVAGFGYHQ